jgi:hypothetical protein
MGSISCFIDSLDSSTEWFVLAGKRESTPRFWREVLGNRRFGRSPFQAHLLLEVGSFQLILLDDYLVEVSKEWEFHRDDTDRPKYRMSV